ncbi:MAG: CBS domain-containing protein [Chitinophagaceae bacterium]
MLTVELINQSIPQIQLQDSVKKALQLINDFRVTHLPVVSDDKFLGLVSEDDLLDAEDSKLPIQILQDTFLKVAVHENEHFLKAIHLCNEFTTSIVPVVGEENELMGVITSTDLLKIIGEFNGAKEIGGLIVLEMERSKFTISEISRITESNDATILHLNTIVHPETGMLTVTIHLNKKEIASTVATFERYDYDVIYFFGNEQFENEIHSNYRHLMNYLDI